MESARSMNILVVEDDADDTSLLRRQIATAQIDEHVTTVKSGEDALNYLLKKNEPPPLAIFLDLRLPGLSGIDLLKAVRQQPRLKEVPVIIMTGSTNPNDVKECERLGVTAFLPKPIRLSTFIKTVAYLFPKATGLKTNL